MKKLYLFIAIIILSPTTFVFSQNITPAQFEELQKMGIDKNTILKEIENQNKNTSQATLKLNTEPVITDTQKKETIDSTILLNNSKINSYNSMPEKIFGQNFFRKNNINIYQNAKEINPGDNYILSSGDEINISVWGNVDYNEKFAINNEGYIAPKQIGRIYLKGIPLGKAKSILRSRFGNIFDLSASQFDMSLIYSRVITVNIVGEVVKPGSYIIPACNTPFNALILAGGPTDNGSLRSIYIKRNGYIIDSLDVYKFLLDPKYNKEIFLENNDYLFVPPLKKVVAISGEIKREHNYELKPDENLMDLVNYAGGILGSTYTKNIYIKRYLENRTELININFDSLVKNKKDFILFDKDEIRFNKIPDYVKNSVTIIGAVNLPGTYELKDSMRVFDLLVKAEGLSIDAYTQKAYVIRLNDDMTKYYIPINIENILNDINSPYNIILKPLDELRILSKNDFKNNDTVTIYGDVRIPKSIEYGDKLTLQDALEMCGGLTYHAATNRIEIVRTYEKDPSTKTIKPIQKKSILITVKGTIFNDNSLKEILLMPMDEIFVRKEPYFIGDEKVIIRGEVKYPGIYPILKSDEKISDIIERAGGVTQYAYTQNAYLSRSKQSEKDVCIYLDKALKRKNSKYNICVYNGDVITVPKSEDLVTIKGKINNYYTNETKVPYSKMKRANFYIKEYTGNYNKNADKSNILVVYPNGVTKKTKQILLFRIHPRVPVNSIIVVNEKERKEKKENTSIDWNKAIENTTIKLTGLLTLWVLFKNIK